MTNRVIVYTRPNGVLAVCVPAPADRRIVHIEGKPPFLEPEDVWLNRVRLRSVPKDAANVQIVDRSDIPADRTFRAAWVSSGSSVAVDMPRARDVHRMRMRRKRKAAFLDLDAAYQRADEIGDAQAKAEIGKRRQALRDAPAHPDIESAQTPEQLKAVWPL